MLSLRAHRAFLWMALLSLAPWKVLLIMQILWFGGASAAGPLGTAAEKARGIFNMPADKLPHPHLISAIFPIATILSIFGLIMIGLAKHVRQTRQRSAAKASSADARQKTLAGKSDWDRKLEAAQLWHGCGGSTKPLAQKAAAAKLGLGQDTLRRLLERAFADYNLAHVETNRLHRLEDLRSVKFSVLKSYLTPAECGRGDRLSDWEKEQIKEKYMLRCKNFKDVPESALTNDSENDEFARTVNEVFAISRLTHQKKKTAEEYSNFAIRKWAREMDVVSTGTVPGTDSRSAAVGDWRNMISSLVMWVAVTMSFSKPIPAACMYNMDDTTVFLEQKFGRNSKRTFVSKEVKDDLRARSLSFSFGVSKSKRQKKNKKRANMQARTVKILLCTCGDGSVACTVVKIKDESITRFEIESIHDRLYVVWDPKIPKTGHRAPAEPKQVRVQRTAMIMQHAILPCIVEDLKQKRARQQAAANVHSVLEDGSQHSSQDSRAADECYDRAVLSMDGDFAQIESILEIETMTAAFAAANVELFKFAAGASMTQQPNDRSRCFYCLKKALHENRMKIQQDISVTIASLSPRHKKVLRKLEKLIPDRGKSKASFATFNFFLSSCDAVFSYAFNIPNVRGGWHKCGLAPFNPKMIMISFAFFKDLEKLAPNATQRVLDATSALAAIARESGSVTDRQMEEALGDLFAEAPALARAYHRPVAANAPVNHRRCIWLSNPGFLDRERDLRRQRVQVPAARQPVAAAPVILAAGASHAIPVCSLKNPSAPWRFPCQWTFSVSGIVMQCGSSDKKKSQHLKSSQHKKFVVDVEAKELEETAEGSGFLDHEGLGIEMEDPLVEALCADFLVDGDDSDNSINDSDSDDEDEVFHVTTPAGSPKSGLSSLFRALLIAHARCRCRCGCFFSRRWCSCFAAAQTSLPNSRRLSSRCSVRSAKLALVNKKCARE